MEGSVDGQARVYLRPIAPPSILALYAFAGSTLILAAELAGWYGNYQTALFLFPFAAAFGGVAWTFIVSAVCAWYTASALMFEGVAGRRRAGVTQGQ